VVQREDVFAGHFQPKGAIHAKLTTGEGCINGFLYRFPFDAHRLPERSGEATLQAAVGISGHYKGIARKPPGRISKCGGYDGLPNLGNKKHLVRSFGTHVCPPHHTLDVADAVGTQSKRVQRRLSRHPVSASFGAGMDHSLQVPGLVWLGTYNRAGINVEKRPSGLRWRQSRLVSPVHVNWTKRPLHGKTATDNPK
jgi:hypothetical protein